MRTSAAARRRRDAMLRSRGFDLVLHPVNPIRQCPHSAHTKYAHDQKSFPWMKALLVVGILGVCAVGALAYGVYWVKNKVETTAAEHGITPPSGGGGSSHRSSSNKP